VAAAVSFLPHEEAHLAFFCPIAHRVRQLISTRGSNPLLTEPYEDWLMDHAEVARIGPAETSVDLGRAWLRVPLKMQGPTHGVVVLYAEPGKTFCSNDLSRAQWIADGVATTLEPLVARLPDPLDISEELIREIGHVLDVREVFDRISDVVKRVLPHDKLTMTFHSPDGVVGLQAESSAHNPPWKVKVGGDVLSRPFVLLPELTERGLVGHPEEAAKFLLSTGFKSFLAVNLDANEQRIGVEFWSDTLGRFSMEDVPLARRIGTYVALAVSHHQLAEASRVVAAARSREQRLEARVKTLSAEANARSKSGQVVGVSKPWRSVLRAAAQVAATDTTVLLTGESGTGKEVVARFIHAASKMSQGPFAGVNCAALPEQLLESELFGYERGAFTGATHNKPGQIELAAGGILFLDEVSEMSLSAQAKFLRVLQEREFRRLGGTKLLHANVRVIAATNVDLRKAIERGTFRRDLYYRLRVFDLYIQPLRERRDDIVPLTDAILEEIARRLERPRPALTADAREALLEHDWPGNVRELRNVLERAAIICEDDPIGVEHLSFDGDAADEPASTTNLSVVERETIARVLRECGGNKSRAAKRLGLSRMQLYVRLRRYQFEADPN
jgi:transcriptional regulator with GAF, ATPase, and Fis domain